MSARFRRAELARVALAMQKAGVDNYEVAFDDDGRPVVRVRSSPVSAGANDAEQALLDELNDWDAKQASAA